MGFFDEIDIIGSSGSVDNPIATLARLTGPLERGLFDPVTQVWIPGADSPVVGLAPDFGIDTGGNLYFDTNGPDEGETADLRLQADGTLGMTFLSGGDR